MVDVPFVGQLVSSMETAVLQLEQAISKEDINMANQLRTFIFDLYSQIDKEISRKNV